MKKRFWFLILGLAFLVLVGVFSSYFFWFKFKLEYRLSESGEVWGQFGDFVGGILNPILSFITILILVISSLYQQKQNANTEKRDNLKRLDDRFYGMLSYQREYYETAVISINVERKIPVKDIASVFEDMFFSSGNLSLIDQHSVKSSIFVMVRQFYLILKIIDEAYIDLPLSEFERGKYYTWLLNMTDYSLVRLVFFCAFYYKGIPAFDYIRNNENFILEAKSLGIKSYIDNIERRKSELGVD